MSRFSIVIITQNEEDNIAHCLAPCLEQSDDVWVVDSFSTDATPQICKDMGAQVVSHRFMSWGDQRNFALEHLPLKHQFILFLDADEQINREFANELNSKILTDPCDIYYVNFNIIFLGRVLRFAHENPPILRILRKGKGKWISEGARENAVFEGTTGKIHSRIRHEDRKGLFFWLMKHLRNADREANELSFLRSNALSGNHPIKMERHLRFYLRRVYNCLPFAVRSTLVFLYRYIGRLGLLDGYPGFVFCFLQAYWYPVIIDARFYEMKLGTAHYLPEYGMTAVKKCKS